MSEGNYETLKSLLGPERKAGIFIRPDPDSLASAWALSRLFHKHKSSAEIIITEPIKRMENRNMTKLLGISYTPLKETKIGSFDRFCIVDGQPNQFPEIPRKQWDIVIDHHPLVQGYSYGFADLRPEMGATSSIMVEYLDAARIKITEKLATALCYGIITDTEHFQRAMTRKDAEAFSRLFPRVNYRLLQMIVQAEVQFKHLALFDLAIHRLKVKARRAVVHLGPADSADIAVILADFFLRVSGIQFVAVSVIWESKLIIIFRSRDLRKNAGAIAKARFGDLGSAGGHHAAARAEIPFERLPAEVVLYDPDTIERFIEKRLSKPGRTSGKR